jgi:hypothetical protein
MTSENIANVIRGFLLKKLSPLLFPLPLFGGRLFIKLYFPLKIFKKFEGYSTKNVV